MPDLPAYEFCLQAGGDFLLIGPECGNGVTCADMLAAYDYWRRCLAPKDAALVIGNWRGLFRGPARVRAS